MSDPHNSFDDGSFDDFSSIIGVIDLIQGNAVAAQGGRRDEYRPIESIQGNALALVDHYARLGCGGIYVADLDAIRWNRPQESILKSIAKQWIRRRTTATGARQSDSRWLIDAGYRGRTHAWMRQSCFDSVCWIAASETCHTADVAAQLSTDFGPERSAISLDYRSGADSPEPIFLGSDEPDWYAHLGTGIFSTAVTLNLSDVGSRGGGPFRDRIQAICRQYPQVDWISGGGIRRQSDADGLLAAGCQGVLVATAISPGLR